MAAPTVHLVTTFPPKPSSLLSYDDDYEKYPSNLAVCLSSSLRYTQRQCSVGLLQSHKYIHGADQW
jgi:hypothetical protein